jgi:hypothetical protein
MKSIYKYLSISAVSGSLCLFLSLSASAQHNRGGGGDNRPAPSAPAPAPAAPRAQPSAAPRSSFSGSRQSSGQRTGTVQRSTTRQYSGHTGVTNTRPAATIGTQKYRTYQNSSAYGHNHVQAKTGVNTYRVGAKGAFRGGGYHYNHGYYGSYYAPRLGFSIGVLPFGYYPFYFGDEQYYYSDGLFYNYDDNQYTVVEPPIGAEVTTLPSGAQSIVINGQQFYEANGVYYQPITKDDGSLSYQVAGKDGELNTGDGTGDDTAQPAPLQIGDIVDALPPQCQKINLNGQKLYVSPDGVYYKVQVDQSGNKSYKVVGLPADDNDQDQSGGQAQPDPNQGGN